MTSVSRRPAAPRCCGAALAVLALTVAWGGMSPPRAQAAGVPREAHELMQRIAAPVRACYARELQRDPEFVLPDPVPGVQVELLRSGALRLVLVGSSGRATLDRCLRRALRQVRIPRDRRPVREQYPLLFTREGEPRVLRFR